MRTFRSAEAWARNLERKYGTSFPFQAKKALRYEADKVKSRIQEDLVGAASQPQWGWRAPWLAENDHPFATRHGAPLAASIPIGVQHGDLEKSIRMKPSTTGGIYGIAVVSSAPAAPFIFAQDGTVNMVPRGAKQHAEMLAREASHRLVIDLSRILRRL